MNRLMAIQHAAELAACLTRAEYQASGLEQTVMSYDLARSAARDRGFTLCTNIDVDTTPANVGAALLKMFDDINALKGQPRRYQHTYTPRVIEN